jgi:hypothetical protein
MWPRSYICDEPYADKRGHGAATPVNSAEKFVLLN